jgi:hypothetical protein
MPVEAKTMIIPKNDTAIEKFRTYFWIIISVGIVLPWLVGISVKLYLQSLGKPTQPYSNFYYPPEIIWYEALMTLWWASPFIGLANLALHWKRFQIIIITFIFGVVGATTCFIGYWQSLSEVESIIYAFIIPIIILTAMGVGLLAGLVVSGVGLLLRKVRGSGEC